MNSFFTLYKLHTTVNKVVIIFCSSLHLLKILIIKAMKGVIKMLILINTIFSLLIVYLLLSTILFVLLQDNENFDINWSNLSLIFFNMWIIWELGKSKYPTFICILFAIVLIFLHESCLNIILNELSSYTDFSYKLEIHFKNILSCIPLILFLAIINYNLKTKFIIYIFFFLVLKSFVELVFFIYSYYIIGKNVGIKPMMFYIVPFFYHLFLIIVFSIIK